MSRVSGNEGDKNRAFATAPLTPNTYREEHIVSQPKGSSLLNMPANSVLSHRSESLGDRLAESSLIFGDPS